MCVCLLPPSLKVFAPPFRVDSMRPFSWTPRKSHPKWSSCLETFAPSNIMWSLSSDTVNGPLGHLGRENPFPSTAACVLSATGGSREKENCFEQNVHSLWPSLSKPGHVVVQLFQLCIAYCSCMGDLCYATCTFIPLPLTLWLKGKGTVLFFFFSFQRNILIYLVHNHIQITLQCFMNATFVSQGREKKPRLQNQINTFKVLCKSLKSGTLSSLHSWSLSPHRWFHIERNIRASKTQCSLPWVTHEFLCHLLSVDYLHQAITQDLLSLVSYTEGKAGPFTQSLSIRLWC